MKRRISVGYLEIGEEERNAIIEVLNSGRISEGEKTYEFEKKWADFIGTKYCVPTSSGTAALITVFHVLKYLYKLEEGTEVITSPLTYISDVNAIVLSGFTPLFVDIDPYTFSIIPEKIVEILKVHKDKVKIVLAIDLMGYPADLEKIKKIAEEYDLIVIEDAAEAHGTIYKGKRCGSNGEAGIFSFYIAHNIQAGEMGAITTDNYDIYSLSKKIKTNGRFCDCQVCTRYKEDCPYIELNNNGNDLDNDFDPRFFHQLIGYNFKTMEFQSAIALVQLKRIEKIIRKRQYNVKYLNEGLKGFSDVLQLPFYSEDVSYLAYPIIIKKPEVISRKKLRWELEKKGIETRPLFGCIPIHQPAYAYLKKQYKGRLPNAEYIGKNGFYIGCHQYLTVEDLDYVISVFKEIIKGEL